VLYLAAAVTAYLIGSFPTAYVIVKFARKGTDITRSGTGSIGAMNAHEVTGSKAVGISVAVIDILKGIIVTLFFQSHSGLIAGLTAALFAVLGHNYSIFMMFRGGRGLATAAGALLIVQPIAVVVYLAVYFALRASKLKLYLSSVAGIFCAAVPIFIKLADVPEAEILCALLLLVVLSKHAIPLRNELRNAS